MLYRPKPPSIFDSADVFNPINRELRGLWCFGPRHTADVSQYRRSAVTVSNPTWTGRGIQYNADGYIDYGDLEHVRYSDGANPDGFSFEAIFTLDSHNNGEYPRIFSKLSDSPYNGYELLVRSPDDGSAFVQRRIYFQNGNAGSLGQWSSSLVVAGQRHHCIVTIRPGSNPALYMDGVSNDAATFGTPIVGATSAPLVIGKWAGTLTNGIRGSIEKVALYGRALSSSDVHRLFNDPYWHFSTRKVFLFGCGQAEFCRVDAPHTCDVDLRSQTAYLDLTTAPTVEWTAPQPSGKWTIDALHQADFAGLGSRVGRFDCAAPETSCDWSGRQLGPVTWSIDAPHELEWIIGGGLVKKDCLAGDGRFAAVTGDTDLERNYVF